MAGPFDAYLDDLKKREAARTAMQLQANPLTPDQASAGLAMAQELGVPAGHVLMAPERFKTQFEHQRAAKSLADAPKLADWLRSDPVNAALAKDDLDNLGWFNRGLKSFSLIGQSYTDGQVARGVKTGVTGVKQLANAALTVPLAGTHKTLLDQLDAFERAKDMPQDMARFDIAKQLGIDPESDLAAMAADFVGADPETRKLYVDDVTRSVTGNRELMDSLVARVRAYSAQMKTTQGRVPNFTDARDLKDFADWAGFNIGQALPYMASTMAAGLVGGPVGVGAAGYGMGAGDIRAEQIEQGQDPYDTKAAGAAALGAVPYAALEYLGPAAKPFRGVSSGVMQQVSAGWAKRMGREVVESSVEEFINEAGQEIIKDYAIQMGGGEDVVLDDATLLKWFNAGMAGAVSGGGMGAAQTAYSGVARDTARAERAGQTSQLLDEVARQAEASKLRARTPDRFRDLLDRMQAENETSAVYVPAEGLREYFQARDLTLDAEIAAAWGLNLDEFAEMEATGGKVALPISNFAAYIAGTEAEAWVRENATLLPDEMSEAEGRDFSARLPDHLVDEYEREMRQIRDDDARRTSDQQVYDGFHAQLRAAGRTSDVAEKEARVLGAFFRTMADRTGEDSLDLSRRFGLAIKGPDAPGIPRRRGSLDILLNDLRAGRKEKTGRSLTQFVIDEGGVQDTGGDVAELQVRGLVAETAAEIRARRDQAVMPGSMPTQGKGLALDELGRKAVEAGYFPELMGEVQGLNEGEAADLGAALLEALRDEQSGNARYIEGEGPDPARAALNDALQRLGIDPAAMSNDDIAAALEADQDGQEYGQSVQTAPVQIDPETQVAAVQIVAPSEAVDWRSEIDWLKSNLQGKAFAAPTGETVRISAQSRKALSSNRGNPLKAAVVRALPDLIQNAPIYSRLSDTKGRDNLSYAYAAGAVEIDGKPYAVGLRYRVDGQGGAIVYQLEGYDMRPGGSISADAQRRPSQPSPDRTYNVGQIVESFNDDVLFQGNKTKRGSVQFPAGGPDGAQTVINLFESADLSTMIHESGHYFLEVMDALGKDANAPQDVRDDMAAVRRYLGAEGGQPFTVEQHETFARSLEAYLMEGKAPSLELADVFARAKAWLLNIYRSLAGLNVKLTPEIREVFDRMLATDAEIEAARAEIAAGPLFRDKPAGMSDADWKAYQRLAQRSKDQADARLIERTLEAVRRKTERWWKDERKQVMAEAMARRVALPQHMLIQAMANGVRLGPDGQKLADVATIKISRKDLIDQFGPGVIAELSRAKFGGRSAIYADEGISPSLAADMFGFADAGAMIQILQNTGKLRDEVVAEADAIMLDRYGDALNDGSIEAEAMDAVHNSQQEQKNVAEARAMAARLGRPTRNMTARDYKARARAMLGRMTVREATQSARFLAAERKAGRTAEQAFARVARGDHGALAEAFQAKEQQILNAALYDLSREAADQVARVREKFQTYSKASARKALEGGYIEQIDDILDRYDFRKRGPGQIGKLERIREFIDRMVADGREAELAIDPRMMDESRRIHYSRLPLEEFRGLVDTVANLDHLGRFKQKLINARRKRDFDASRARIMGQVEQRGRDQMSGPRSKPAQALREILNTSKTSHTIATELDGLEEIGPVFDELLADVYEGEKREAAMRIEMEQGMNDLLRAHYTRQQIAEMKPQRHINGANGRLWSKSEILSVALNTGNPDNFQRLTDEKVAKSERLSRDQVDALLATLDENDWRFVQAYWDQIDSLAPQLAEVHKRRTGVAMKKVGAKQMASAPDFVRGGYYPIKYDPTKSARAMDDAGSLWDKVMSSGRGGRPEVNAGRTIDRKASGNGRALRFDLGVGIEGMRETIRIITLSEAVDNSGRLLRDGEVKQMFLDRQLEHEWTMLDLTLQDVASGPIFHGFWGERAARVLKNNVSAMFLGFNPKTALLQFTGAAQSAAVIGPRNLAKGYLKYRQDRGELLARIKAVSPLMAERERTVNKDYADMMADPANTNPVRGRAASAVSTIREAGYVPMQKIQYYTVDVPTWAGAYLSQIEAGESEAKAMAYADLMVTRAQGGSFMTERSAWSRGTVSRDIRQSAMVRIFTTLAGFMIVRLNRGLIAAQRGAKNIREADTMSEKAGAAANMAMNLTLIYVADAVFMSLLNELRDDDDDKDDMLKQIAKDIGMSMVGGFPAIRDVIGFAAEKRGAGGMHETIGAIPGRIWQEAGQGENDRAFRSAVAQGVGAVTGLPTTATMRVIEEAIDSDDRSWAEMFLGKNPLDR